MAGIVIVLPKIQDGKMIKNLLLQNGFSEITVCGSGAQAIAQTDFMEDGIVISGYKLADMMYSELAEDLPTGFKLLLMASASQLSDSRGEDIMSLTIPFRVTDLLNTVELLLGTVSNDRKKKKEAHKKRSPEEEQLINDAKAILIGRNNMSEKEAHRYIQKCSMDNSVSLVETARMILAMR